MHSCRRCRRRGFQKDLCSPELEEAGCGAEPETRQSTTSQLGQGRRVSARLGQPCHREDHLDWDSQALCPGAAPATPSPAASSTLGSKGYAHPQSHYLSSGGRIAEKLPSVFQGQKAVVFSSDACHSQGKHERRAAQQRGMVWGSCFWAGGWMQAGTMERGGIRAEACPELMQDPKRGTGVREAQCCEARGQIPATWCEHVGSVSAVGLPGCVGAGPDALRGTGTSLQTAGRQSQEWA